MSTYQKLLWPGQINYFADGNALLAGYVAPLDDVVDFTDVAQIIDAHGCADLAAYRNADHVDVLRFRATPAMQFDIPTTIDEPGWPAHRAGFANTRLGLVPIWNLSPTRVPAGAEIWRFSQSEPEPIVTYLGLAGGWHPSDVWRPPSELVGTRIEVDGEEYPADLTWEGTVEVLSLGPSTPPGFEPIRGMAHRRLLPATSAAGLFEVILTGTVDGVACRVVESRQDGLVLWLTDVDPSTMQRLGATLVEPNQWIMLAAPDRVESVLGIHRFTSEAQ